MKIIKGLLNSRKKAVVFLTLLLIVGFAAWKVLGNKPQKPKFQTAIAEKGTLIVTVTASGQVSEANSAVVATKASGVVSQVYVENGQKVKTGDKIAEIELDLEGKQRTSSAWSSYLSSKNALETAKINYYSLHSDLLTSWKTFIDTAQSSTYQWFTDKRHFAVWRPWRGRHNENEPMILAVRKSFFK